MMISRRRCSNRRIDDINIIIVSIWPNVKFKCQNKLNCQLFLWFYMRQSVHFEIICYKMMKFTKCGILISENIIKLSKRTLINGLALGIARYEKNRQIAKLQKNTSHFMYQINHSPIPDLLHSTKLWTVMVTNLDGELDLLKHGLTRVYEHCSEIQAEQDVGALHDLGPSTIRMFHYLDLPMKALKVSMYSLFIFIFLILLKFIEIY